MNVTCNLDKFLRPSDIELEDDFIEAASEDQLMENNLAEEDDISPVMSNLGK